MISLDTADFFFFFFQAEDGIRDLTVTGVQTCALPISLGCGTTSDPARSRLASLQDVVQRHPVDFAVHPHPHVVVLPVHEVRERLEKLAVRDTLGRREPFLLLVARLAQQAWISLPH